MRIRATEEQIQAAFEVTKDDPAWTESNRLIAEGRLPSQMYQALAIRPDILTALGGWSRTVYPGGLLETALKERVVVLVSQESQCQYCAGSHGRSLRRMGLDPSDALTEREAAALDYTRAALSDTGNRDAVWDKTHAVFSDAEIVELTLCIGLTRMLNLFNDCLGNRYNGEYEATAASPSAP